ncbi:hypothetical protein CROQUDRAFT_655362 [Cronartium quercuum f. sp. fusiforme G11]|uniref:Uncharacterized protein n=1 Tax=Cronartium quercuum f. sp. fusiforme G11 TaxID=708437 RepID=A0A9P6NR13_9BASI|nr:hypothetical protein CROQUDRAFT_655362 [Cronartium quercuum f. sp. fusiforme G11]
MPTLTLSWTDIALVLLTASVIGGAAIAGSHIRPTSESASGGTEVKNKARATKKKKNSRAKKTAPRTEAEPLPSPTSSGPPSPEPELEEPKKQTKPEPVNAAKAGSKKKPVRSTIDEQEFPPLVAPVPPFSPKPSNDTERSESNPTRPFAERMQAPVRKTKVDDMIDEDVERPVRMARVMKIVDESSGASSVAESDAEDGWEKVSDGKKSRGGGKTMTLKMSTTGSVGAARPPGSASTTAAASKRQRQNAKKKEAAKAAKAAEEAERLGRLSAHKRQQERVRINEQAGRSTSSSTSKSKEVGGGMKASIGEDGRLIWE